MSKERKARGMFGAVAKGSQSQKAVKPHISDDDIEDGDKPFANSQPGQSSGKLLNSSLSSGSDAPSTAGQLDSPYREVAAKAIRNWEYKDRQFEELQGDPSYSDLLASAREHGIIEPLIVREIDEDESGCSYEVLVGFKRLSVARVLDISVPVLVKNVGDRAASLIQFAENTGRSTPSPWSYAMHYQKLLDDGVFGSQQELADAQNLNKGTLSNLVRVVRKMPEDLIKAFDLYSLSSRSLIHLMHVLDSFEGNKEALIDRLVEYADDINAKPDKAQAVFDKAVLSLCSAGEVEDRPVKAVYQSSKGKTLTVHSKPTGVQLTVHPAVLGVMSADELVEIVSNHLAAKGITIEKK